MKNLKNTLIISSYVLLVGLFFSGGYALGRSSVADVEDDEVPIYAETSAEREIEMPEYEVVIEDDYLRIYKCIGNIRSEIVSEKVSEGVFPAEDVEELKNGVRFERLEQAQQMFENFVS